MVTGTRECHGVHESLVYYAIYGLVYLLHRFQREARSEAKVWKLLYERTTWLPLR